MTAPLALPAFAFGRGEAPLALMGGPLILDSGEAENTFPFRCQDRFLAYTTLLGLPSVLLALDAAHAARLRALSAQLQARLRMLLEWQGLPAPAPVALLVVQCDLMRLALAADAAFDAQAAALAAAGRSVGLLANQVSPTGARMMGALAQLLSARGVTVVFDAQACTRAGALALDWHNKARFLRLRPALAASGMPWAPTAVVAPREFLAQPQWHALAARAMRAWPLASPPDALFLKSAQDSSGNVSALASMAADPARNTAFLAEVRRWLLAEDFADAASLRELRAECELPPSLDGAHFSDGQLAALRRRQAERRGGIDLLAQPVLRPPAGDARHASIGVTVMVEADGAAHVAAVNAQLYRDAERRQFLGILLDDAIAADPAVAAFAAQCHAAAGVLAAQGWRGPVNFDACLGEDGRYWFTGDCNPRLTALYVPLAVRLWLAGRGVAARGVISLGYRGEAVIDALPAALQAWSAEGLLFDARAGRGMLLLPNLARRHGHDLLAINLDRAAASDALARMRALAPHCIPAHLEAIHG